MVDHVAVAIAISEIGGPRLESQQTKVVRALQGAYLLPKGRTTGLSRLDNLDGAEVLALSLALLMPPTPFSTIHQMVQGIMHARRIDDLYFGDAFVEALLAGHAEGVTIGWYNDSFYRDRYECTLNGTLYGAAQNEPADRPVMQGMKLGTKAIEVLSKLVKIAGN